MTPAFSESDLKEVRRHIETILPRLIRPPGPHLPFPWLTPSHGDGYANTMYYWDAHHIALRLAYDQKPEYLRHLVDNALAHQAGSGFVPGVVHIHDGPAHTHPPWHAHPFMAQGAWLYVSLADDRAWGGRRLEPLRKYLAYYENHFAAPYGLFRWQAIFMGGMDNDVVSFFQPGAVITPDINAWLYLEYQALADLAGRLGVVAAESECRDRAAALARAINQQLWLEEEQTYAAYHLTEGRLILHLHARGARGAVQAPYAFQTASNLIPLYAGVAPPDRAAAMLRRYVLHPEHFLSPHGIRSLSRASEYYNNARRGNPPRFGYPDRLTNSNWQGPVWILLSYFMFNALLTYGFQSEAEDLAVRTLRTLARSLESIGSFTENYHGETGEPGLIPEFGSWNVLADIMPRELAGSRLGGRRTLA